MSRFLLEAFFTLIAVGGLFLLLYGIMMKPDGDAEKTRDGEENLFELPFSHDDSAGLFEPKPNADTLGQGGKEAFDPEKHQPETIGSRKTDVG